MMKQNKKYVAIFCTLIMLISFVSISAFAYTDNSDNNVDFDSQPIAFFSSVPTGSTLVANGTVICTDPNNSNNNLYCGITEINADTYVFAIPYDEQLYHFYAASIDYGARIYSGTQYSTRNVLINAFDSNSNLYYRQFDSMNSTIGRVLDVPLFNNVSTGLYAVRDWIDNPPVSSSSHTLNISLPAGNAVYIDVHGLNPSATITTTTPQQYHASPFTSNQLISYTDSISTSGSIAGSPIEWSGTGKTDLFGRYRNWTRTLIVNPSKTYICIVNPYYNSNYVDVEHYDANSAINISVSSAYSYKFVALNSNVSSGTIENTNSDDTYSGEYDPNTDTWSTIDDSTGLPGSPSQGGNIIPQTANSINDWLENIAKQIGNFFSGAIGAVSTLVNAGQEFFGVLTGLYSWLPPAVFSVLSSALIVVITIGVIKVFI